MGRSYRVSSRPVYRMGAGLNIRTLRAPGYYREALALADVLGMRPLVAHCHLGLGKLYGRTGNRQQAQDHLATATAMYREMGMDFWLEQAEAALGPPARNSP